MKFPEQRFSMETALPPSVQNWFGHELEIRGIDSVIYSRHIIQLLQQEDLDDTEFPDYVDLLFDARNEGKGKFKLKKLEKKQNTKNQEERKRNAAIKCLQAVCEEANGIDALVDELCNRLKNLNTNKSTEKEIPAQKESSSSSTESDASSSELDDPAERYYAAFPALHGNDQQSSPVGAESLHVWKNNPITKTTSLKESSKPGKASSEYDHSREKKLKKVTQRKRNLSRPCQRKTPEGGGHQRYRGDIMRKEVKGNVEQNEYNRICRFLSWPQGKVDTSNSTEPDSNQDRELCSKVETLLKEMLLHKDESHQDRPIAKPASVNEGSVSPELQENDLWYTQPIEVLFSSDESRKRLYKRNSNPLFASSGSSPSFDEEEQLILLEDNLANLKVAIASEEEEDDVTAVAEKLSKSLPENLTYDVFSRDLDDVKSTSPIPIPNRCEASAESSLSETILSSLHTQSAFLTSPYDNLLDASSDESQSSGSQASVLGVGSVPGQSTGETPDSNLSLLDKNYLIGLAEKLDPVDCPFLPFQSLTAIGLPSLPEMDESTWPSKVLFADFVLPYDLIWNDVGIEYSTEFSERLKSGNLSQVWDVNYQKIKGTYLPYKNIWAPVDFADQGWFYPVVSWEEDFTTRHGFDQIWESDARQTEVGYGEDTSSLIDIPQITFDLASEVGSEYDNLLYDADDFLQGMDDADKEANKEQQMMYGDFSMMWAAMDHTPNHLKMSRSFELVPSEGSAFVDAIPQKLHHVQSEPNLRYCSLENQEFRSPHRKTKSDSQTPEEEHLYFSPKTHFRPIQTPDSQDSMTDYHLKDLFGGYPASKTPYQKYHDKDSDTEEFVPMFKIRKDLDKYIQTGSSLEEHADNCKEVLGRNHMNINTYSEAEGSTTLITEDFDIIGYVDSLTASAKNTPQNFGDAQYANFDSGYEDTDGDGYMERSEKREECKRHNNLNSPVQMVGHNWQADLKCQESDEAEKKPVCSCPTRYNVEDTYCTGYGESYNNVFLSESEPVVHHWMISQAWGLDPGSVTGEEESTIPQNIWSSSDDHVSAVFNYTDANDDESYSKKEKDGASSNLATETTTGTSYGHSYSELCSYFPNGFDRPDDGKEERNSTLEEKDGRMPFLDKENHPPAKGNGDIVKVKLVIRKGKTRRDIEEGNGQSLLFMPMPIAAVYSCELEEAWMTQHFNPEFLHHSYSEHTCISKGSKRKPCTFFMEGACRRSDCKYAHDLSGITCRFWMNGDCFKGDMCPFLHGFPANKRSPDSLQDSCEQTFEFQPEDFPVLEEPLKDAKRPRIVRMNNKQKQTKQPLKSCKEHLNRKSQKSFKEERVKHMEKRHGLKRKSSGCGITKDSVVL